MNRPRGSTRNRWLTSIGALKLGEAVFFAFMGFGVFKLLHKDIADILLRLVEALRIDPESRAIDLLLDKIALLDIHRLKLIGSALFLYASLGVVEGVGLLLERAWAEYFTLILTASFLPWEIFEISRRHSAPRILLTLLNLAILAYLAALVRERRRKRHNRRRDE